MTKNRTLVTFDGNEAVAYVAYRVNEICCIYPITPSSTMGELADQWSTEGIPNIWGNLPTVVEMQSEGGASGAIHGALQTGALSTTFTASQGLLLMIPNMYKIAGELTATVFHVAARSLATQGLSIFGDHADVMAVRTTGFAMLSSSSVQEAHDMALIAHASTLETRIPFLHFFDGFRTSHEVNKLTLLSDEEIRAMIRDDLVIAHRGRGLNPDNPFMRGTAQNPDIYFQARETVNPFYQSVPGIVQEKMDALFELTGRRYRLFDYYGDEDAERIVILMGSGAEMTRETVEFLNRQEEKVGVIQVRLYRPFSTPHLMSILPSSVQAIAVLDRVKEPGAMGEPLYMDVMAALGEAKENGTLPTAQMPRIIGGRYGLSSKEFTPAMAKAVFDELRKDQPKNHFTIGIRDDVSHTSLEFHPEFVIEPDDVVRAMFFGLGADGTVGANKNSIKIIGEDPEFFAQGYFVYDSKKSGSQTVSHLRFGPKPIRSTYLVQSANFIGCHQFNFLETIDVLEQAAKGATFLLNSTHGPDDVWEHLPRRAQTQILQKELTFYIIDAYTVARKTGMGTRINTIMQTCFFAISGVLPREKAIAKIKSAIEKTYSAKGEDVVQHNFRAVDQTLEHLHKVTVPKTVTSAREIPPVVPKDAPEFVQEVTARMMAGRGDDIPVSALPIDGTYPTGTSAWEKRNISLYAPVWQPEICIQCGNCSLVCPHGVIRAKFYNEAELESAPAQFPSALIRGRGFPDVRYTLQIFVEDCTGCALCVEVCPAKDKEKSGTKAINMQLKGKLAEDRENIAFFEKLPENDRGRVDFSTVRGVQYLTPLFAFSGACAGCGETPYLKLVSQLFGPRLIVANATGCSSIYGGNLPTTPWLKNNEGRGPVWSNSLFEDNAEFGFGFRLTADKHHDLATELLNKLRSRLGEELVNEILSAPQEEESEIRAQRGRVAELRKRLETLDSPEARHLSSVADHLVRRSIWIVGGDGWAYDIGYGGLDHVLSMGRDVNVLVLDTEVYSNTGGQVSKSTPLAAVAKFAAGGKPIAKKDLALQAIAYGNVYVARVALGSNPQQAILAFREAETYKGPSLILAYSHCIAHGINMQRGLTQQKMAVDSGYWPLIRYNPRLREQGKNPFLLDSHRPTIEFKKYAYREIRYNVLTRLDPTRAEHLLHLAQEHIDLTWNTYEEMATRGGNGKMAPGLKT
uniref:Pyruvate-flavodoxin oxidoreductase n=1 Tax=Candidatus Kentrum sp. MB TaxID=2138164 RepID=A0A450XFE0_9GAMM|nr:MAG: pyruvate-ferredoxin/flavodoxin oxidoreductase [Candidatus Kentron sp. MB]VFK27991.1 MAG: pyruvate-ferredoxin/flavodoxin oxidoreductase [Candidatus Kentron sp. MB]VFK74507.1 MAG: pyruvate-ferredoxin/flavodoxin oxidoreductase [Candidatus Kentron sp. MB]